MDRRFGMDEIGGRLFRYGIVRQNLVLLAEGPFVILSVNINGRRAVSVQGGEGAEVVGVAVCQEIGGDCQAVFPKNGFDIVSIMTGINDKRLFDVTPDDRTVYFKGTDRKNLDIHAAEDRRAPRCGEAGIIKISVNRSQFYRMKC